MRKMHEMIIEDWNEDHYLSFAESQEQAVEMLEKCFIPVYQEEEPNEYMLISTSEIKRVYVKMTDRSSING